MRRTATVSAFLAASALLACSHGSAPGSSTSDWNGVQDDTVADGLGAVPQEISVQEAGESYDVILDSSSPELDSLAPDAEVSATDTSNSGSADTPGDVNLADVPSLLDVLVPDQDGPPAADVNPALDSAADTPKPWTLVGGCAIPQPGLLPPACVAAACATGEVCVANGTCVPGQSLELPDVATNTAVTGISVNTEGAWMLGFHRKDTTGHWHGGVLHFASAVPTPTWTLEFENPPGVSTYGTVAAASSSGGWLAAAVRWTVDSGAFQVAVWPLSKDGVLTAAGPSAASQSPITYNGMSILGGPRLQIVQLRDQNFLVAWDGSAGGPASGPVAVRLRRLNSNGIPVGNEFSIAPSGTAFAPAIAPLPLGAAGLAWHDSAGTKANAQISTAILAPESEGIAQPLFASLGLYGQETVPSLATWDDGGAILGWKAGNVAKTCPLHVFVRFLGAPKMMPNGGYHELDLDSEGTYRAAPVAAVLDDERAVLAWHNMNPKSQSVFLRRYYRSLDAVDCENTDVAGPTAPAEEDLRMFPVAAPLGAGSFVVAWTTSLNSGPPIGPYFVPRLRYFAN